MTDHGPALYQRKQMLSKVMFARLTAVLIAALCLAACGGSSSEFPTAGVGPIASQYGSGTPQLEGATGPLISREFLRKLAESRVRPTWMKLLGGEDSSAKTKKAGVYVSQFYGGQINGYKRNNKRNG